MKKRKLGFTLIELLAVIVVIVVVLAITIPIISNMIETVKKEAFKATAYSISDSGRFLMANDTNIGYEEFYYLDSVQYNATNLKLDYTGDGPKTGIVILNENKKVAMAIHNGTYCATKSADTNKITIDKTAPEDCNAYNIINTCDTWEQIALKYDVSLAELLKLNNVTDSNSSTCGLDIKIPLSSTSSNSNTAGGKTIYYKTYYSVGYTTYLDNFTSTSYEYTIKLGVLPLNIADIEVVRVTAQSVFESLDDFKRYITKKNMGEVIWPGDVNPAEIDINQASVFKDHALRSDNMTADDVTVMCDETECTATISITVDNMNNVNPNYINSNPIAYIPVKFTVEFNGEPELCAIVTTNDTVPGTLAGTGTSADPFLVESIEDLVALSNNVNAGNTYSGKYISIASSFDFNNKRSYKDYTTTTFGDVNGNGTVEELLTELTTGAGFKPIGNSTNKFSGQMLGNANCIFDLYINRPETSYVGFIGYNNGTVIALSLRDINVKGSDYTGGVAGYNNNTSIIESSISGNITGKNYTGLVTGYFYTYDYPKITSIIAEGNVTGANNVGGLVGYAYNAHYSDNQGYLRGIYKGGTITSTGTSVGRIVGAAGQYNYKPVSLSSLALNDTTINGAMVTSTYPTSNQGADFDDLSDLNDINFVELSLDTYIGGDNDGNGYYWDYDETGKVIRKRIVDNPLIFSMAGSGTAADPYLINTYEDLLQAPLKLNSIYKLNSNLDLTGKRIYSIGSYLNPFTGIIYGNGKSITNLSINSPHNSYSGLVGSNQGTITNLNLNNYNANSKNYVGLVGYNSGTLSNITSNNCDISANDYVGCLAGYSTGTIKDTNLNNFNISGNNYIGGFAGYTNNGNIIASNVNGNVTGNNYIGLVTGYFYTYDYPIITSIIAEGNVTGVNNVGGLVGYAYNAHYSDNQGYLRGVYKGGSITSTGTSVGRIVGAAGQYNYKPVSLSSLALNDTTINGATVTSTYPTSNNGAGINSVSDLNNINLAELALDTYIGGDNDGNGYYWDYDESGNIVSKSINDYPLTFSLAGSGTSVDPYLINNYADLRQATLKLGSSYKLTSNLDLTGDKFYMLGSYLNPFKGTFDANGNTINNLTINNPYGSYTGLSGYNQGTIKNLTLNNFTIDSSNYVGLAGYSTGTISNVTSTNCDINGNDYASCVAGYNQGTISQINLNNFDIIGNNYTGGMSGYNYNGNMLNSIATGNITGNNYTGLVTGYFYTYDYPQITSIMAGGNVTGANNVGGLVGYAYNAHYSDNQGYLRGIYKGGTITSTGTSVGRIVGATGQYNYKPVLLSSLAINATIINGATVTSNSQTSNQGASISNLSNLSDINLVEVSFDTYIGGDNDGDGYYWHADGSGNLIRSSITEYPIVFGLTGSGTTLDPYLVSSYDDLLEAQLKLGAVYKLTSDIDMLGKTNFMLGSYVNPFKGTIVGNNRVISNFTLNLPQIGYVGLFGVNQGSINSLVINNANITGVNYTGVISGTNSGTITDLTLNNVSVLGNNYTGGITGYSSGSIQGSKLSEIDISGHDYTGGMVGYISNTNVVNNIVAGNVTGNNYVGLATGYFYTYNYPNLTSLIVEGDVSGNNYIGGVVGYTYDAHYSSNKGYVQAVYRDGSVTSIGINKGRISGGNGQYNGTYVSFNCAALSSIPINGITVVSTSATNTSGLDITSSDLSVITTYTDRGGFNFTDESLNYIWYIDGGVAKFREGNL